MGYLMILVFATVIAHRSPCRTRPSETEITLQHIINGYLLAELQLNRHNIK